MTAIAHELEIEAVSLGSLLLEPEELTRAIEPDSCFYTQFRREFEKFCKMFLKAEAGSLSYDLE